VTIYILEKLHNLRVFNTEGTDKKMKMKNLPLFFCLLWAIMIQAQIKIGDAPQTILPGSLLELQSNDKTLVITRVNTAQMDLITASEGALVYNTDIGCVHYYNGTEWVNICDAVAGSVSFTSRDSSIHIAATDNNYDLTVGMIDGDSIKTASIGGNRLLDGIIDNDKLAPSNNILRSLIKQLSDSIPVINLMKYYKLQHFKRIVNGFLCTDANNKQRKSKKQGF